ncbi:MAG: AtpZ/AtpI family protein [Chitinophagaceae bacterium]|nr:AtpZ/AtpI family protein [Chitinophagaceae bacterium]
MPQPTTNKKDPKKYKSTTAYLLEYSGLAIQLLVAVGIAVFLGMKTDDWLNLNFHLFAFVLPLLVIVGLLVKVVKDTSKKK